MPTLPRRLAALGLIAAFAARCSSPSAARSDLGIVVMHGKQGAGNDPSIASFIRQLRDAGHAVAIAATSGLPAGPAST